MVGVEIIDCGIEFDFVIGCQDVKDVFGVYFFVFCEFEDDILQWKIQVVGGCQCFMDVGLWFVDCVWYEID